MPAEPSMPLETSEDQEPDMTPGRPKPNASRQQTHPGQEFHSGSPQLDKRAKEGGAESKAPDADGAEQSE